MQQQQQQNRQFAYIFIPYRLPEYSILSKNLYIYIYIYILSKSFIYIYIYIMGIWLIDKSYIRYLVSCKKIETQSIVKSMFALLADSYKRVSSFSSLLYVKPRHHHHNHQGLPTTRILLSLSRHLSPSSIDIGVYSRWHLASGQCWWMSAFPDHPTLMYPLVRD